MEGRFRSIVDGSYARARKGRRGGEAGRPGLIQNNSGLPKHLPSSP